MALWSTKRRFIYGGSALIVLALISSLIFWKFLYHAPACSDGIRNGDEKGIDCGGSCQNLCTADTLEPVTLWSKVFNISGDTYSAVAYVENPNISSKNRLATYQFKIYDSNNKLIIVKEGQTSIPKNKKFAIFETGLVFKGTPPKSADFEFLSFSPWEKDTEKEPEVLLKYGTLTSTSTTPRISGTITSESTATIPELELDVFVLDSKENVVAASRTYVDNLLPQSSQDFVFTWQKKFDLGVEACIDPLDIVLALDRSGSMKSESIVPPEPFNTVKSTAQNFIKNLLDDDQISVISFGDNARKERLLSFSKQFAISAIDNLFLSTSTLEQTNIYDGLANALSELSSSNIRTNSKKAVILLTDGVPTLPVSTAVPKQIDYPIISAQEVANSIKNLGTTIYTIGLGKSINEDFLKSIASDDSHYFFAPSKDTLSGIYTQIGANICPRKPNVITIVYRPL